MNTLKYFKELEDNIGRGDKLEGTTEMQKVIWIKLKIPDSNEEMEFSTQKNTLKDAIYRTWYSDLKCNIYCMTGIKVNMIDVENPLSARLTEMGDHFVIIKDVKEFNLRLKKAFDKLEIDNEWDIVRYYDDKTHEGKLNLFNKSNLYDYQNEVRIVAYPDFHGVLKINIGNISDIAEMYPISVLQSIKIINDTTITLNAR